MPGAARSDKKWFAQNLAKFGRGIENCYKKGLKNNLSPFFHFELVYRSFKSRFSNIIFWSNDHFGCTPSVNCQTRYYAVRKTSLNI